jgi:Icc-related predicted phosphoesterase
MLIYAVADLHGKKQRFAQLERQLTDLNPDVLVIAGDMTNYVNPIPVLTRLNALPVPVLAVRGNTDLKRVEGLLHTYPNLHPLHLTAFTIKHVSIVGLSGTVPVPFRSRIRFREKDLFRQAADLVTAQTVLVAHPPPYGFLDEVAGKIHAGSRRLYHLVVARQPAVLLCGHIHERPGITSIGDTVVVNCNLTRGSSGALIEINPDHSPKVRLLSDTADLSAPMSDLKSNGTDQNQRGPDPETVGDGFGQ